MTILVQQQLREAAERLIAEGENCWPATVERFTELANPAAVLALLDELDQLKAENAELRSVGEQAWMALVGYLPAHQNEVTKAAIDRCMAVLGTKPKEQQP